MCTVSFVPQEDTILLLSNRDEQVKRPAALPPAMYKRGTHTLLYPKDPQGGGTWIGIGERGQVAVLLNGAFKAHRHEPPYRRSRGLVFLDLLAEASFHDGFLHLSLEGIEPFTCISLQEGRLWEDRWDGLHKYSHLKPTGDTLVWTSATLYEEGMAAARKEQLDRWLFEQPELREEALLQFHQQALSYPATNTLRTVSTSLVRLGRNSAEFLYADALQQQWHRQALQFSSRPEFFS